MKLAPGTMITDKVRLREPLSEGGMGTIWLGDHLSLEMTVAVKFILMDLAEASPEVFTRFEREAKAAAQIKSPHVVQVFDHGIRDGVPYIVMEKLDGNTLAEWLDLISHMSLVDVGKIVNQVASALYKAHRISVVHRDIKPDNIFLVEDEDDIFVKLFDFGIAKTGDGHDIPKLTAHGALMGTPVYMSPEQTVDAKGVDANADLWALAVVAYEALTGEIPFEGETLGALVLAIMDGEYMPVSSRLGDETPHGLDGWFARAFDSDPAKRFGGAREMAEAFSKVVDARRGGSAREAPSATFDAKPRGQLATVARTMAEMAPRRRPAPANERTLASADHERAPRQRPRRPPERDDYEHAPRYREEPSRGRGRAPAERRRERRPRDGEDRDSRDDRRPRPRRRPPHEEGLFDEGIFGEDRHDEGRHGDGRYDDGRYGKGRHGDGRYDDNRYDDDIYDDGIYDEDGPRHRDLEPLGSAVDSAGRSIKGSVDFEGMTEAIETATDGHRVRPVVPAGVTKRHRPKGERPQLRDVTLAVLAVAFTTVVEPLLATLPNAPSPFEQAFGERATLATIAAAVLFALVGIRVWDRGRTQSWLLQSAGAGLIGVGLTAAALALAPRLGLQAHVTLLSAVKGLAAVAAVLGFGGYAAMRGRDELSTKVSYGIALLVLGAAGAGAAYRLGRRPVLLLLVDQAAERPAISATLRG